MKLDTNIKGERTPQDQICSELIHRSVWQMRDFVQDLRPIRRALQTITNLGDKPAQDKAQQLSTQLDQFEPSVTMIGQIKSGKTSVVNALVGKPALLPIDVNPWTSVVTSLHLHASSIDPPQQAQFQFFEQGEWDRLISGGGRIGEMAQRAGADEELTKIKEQAQKMRATSQARLGRKFELLLGQSHRYSYFDAPLIERYVCLGDGFDPNNIGDSQGLYADVTKSANLRFQQAGLPLNLCIRDTPGVNDTFMMREQITIQAIRESRLCVVVLSAHQALSSTDLALIRMISNVPSREVIIFVNRIDELADPMSQVPEIRDAILDMLRQHNGPDTAQIVFGSALWAQHAMAGTLADLPTDSQAALLNWSNSPEVEATPKTDPRTILWDLSGLPALYEAIETRLIEGAGRELTTQVAIEASNVLSGLIAKDQVAAKQKVRQAGVHLPQADLQARFEAIKSNSKLDLMQQLDRARSTFEQRVERAHNSFLERATEALIVHLERHGEESVWNYDPTGLRVLLASSYRLLGAGSQLAFSKVAQHSAKQLSTLCSDALKLPEAYFDIKLPKLAQVPPPVSLGQTIALDMKGTWWRRWRFKRRGYQAFASQFHTLIKEETKDFIQAFKTDQANALQRDIVSAFDRYIADQTLRLKSLTEHRHLDHDQLDQLFGLDKLEKREARFRAALEHLEPYCY